MNHASFWDRVHARLDARQDPLDDTALRGHLEAHPELLGEFAALTSAVAPFEESAALSSPPRERTHRRPLRRMAAAAAALIAVGSLTIGAWCGVPAFWWAEVPSETSPHATQPPFPMPDLALDGDVSDYSCRTYSRGPAGTLVRGVQAGNVTLLESEILSTVQPSVTTAHGHSIYTEQAHLRSHIRGDRITQKP